MATITAPVTINGKGPFSAAVTFSAIVKKPSLSIPSMSLPPNDSLLCAQNSIGQMRPAFDPG
jgi:hypothetical protein